MKTIVTCPECRRALQVPEEFFGRSVQCPDCKNTFVAQPPEAPIQITSVSAAASTAAAAGPPPTAPSVPSPPPREASPREASRREPSPREQPRRPEQDYDDLDNDDLRIGRRAAGRDGPLVPDRGGIILALGIVSLVLAFFSFMIYFLPIWIIPMVCGIFGWIMGQRDLKAMREGARDPSGQVMTLVGMILSIVGLCISACVAVFSCGMILFIVIMFTIAANAPPPGPRPR